MKILKKDLSFVDFWGIMSLLVPFYYSNDSDLRLSKDVFFVMVVALSFLLYGMNSRAVHPQVKIPLGLLIITSFFGIFHLSSYESLELWSFFVAGCLFFAHSFTHLSVGNMERLSNWLSFSCIFYSFWVIGNLFGFDLYDVVSQRVPLETAGNTSVEGLKYAVLGALGNKGVSAGFVAITSGFLMRPRFWPLLVFPLTACFLASAEAPLLGMGVALILWGMNGILRRGGPNLLKGKYLPLYALGILAIVLQLPRSFFVGKMGLRLLNWAWALDDTGFSLLGLGLGWVPVGHVSLHPNAQNTFYQLHNEFIEAYVNLGILGFLPILFMLRVCLRQTLGGIPIFHPYLYAGVTALIYSFFWFSLHIGPIAMIMLLTFAVLAKRGTIK